MRPQPEPEQVTCFAADRTAIKRTALSRPIAQAIADGFVSPGKSVFDYGCGRGGDVTRLRDLGVNAAGWDPNFHSDGPLTPSAIVNLGYVVNVIADPSERGQALQAAWGLAGELLIVSARMAWDAHTVRAIPCGDGVVTTAGTFQKFFTQEELRDWIERSLGASSVAAAPGVFYVFRDAATKETFLASRFRRRRATPSPRAREELFEANRELLQPLIDYVDQHGRLPTRAEIGVAESLQRKFGSIPRAFSVVRAITDPERWDAVRLQRQRDLLVYIALGAFRGRPRLSVLPNDLQEDIKALFGTYKAACEEGDQLLFATGKREVLDLGFLAATVGKLTREALYVHLTALEELPPVLRVYEGCARILVGAVPDTTLVKLRRDKSKVSYLTYPDFDDDPHPSLAESLIADLTSLNVYHRDYRTIQNPPILHRKETFVGSDYPDRDKFAKLTDQEERAGLLERPSSIGTRNGWATTLQQHAVTLRGHRVVRKPTSAVTT
jgi:DNA phosphorothioation-associated putative methyltransferase